MQERSVDELPHVKRTRETL